MNWRDATNRAIRTFAQSLLAMLTAANTGILDTDWLQSLSVAGMAALLSILNTLALPPGGSDPDMSGPLDGD